MITNDVGVLWLEAVTRDGVTITVNAVARAFVVDPAAYTSYPGPPGAATLAATEAEIRRHVGERDLSSLSRRPDPAGAGHAGDRRCHWGVEVTLVALTRVKVRRQEDLIRWAERLAS